MTGSQITRRLCTGLFGVTRKKSMADSSRKIDFSTSLEMTGEGAAAG